MDTHLCTHTWRAWERRSYWLDGHSGGPAVERSWVRSCSLCEVSEYRRLPAGITPDNADPELRGWAISPR